MILNSLRLINIRSYVDEEIIFPKGSLLLSGDIGSGKSSILLAIEFSLFGVKRGEFSGNSLLRNGENNGSVELKMSINLKEYIIHRKLKRTKEGVKQESGYIVINGTKYDLTPIELKSKIYEILGYPQNLISKTKDSIFRFTVYTPQEDMKHILMVNEDERLDTLRRIFDMDKYKRIKENCSGYLRELRSNYKLIDMNIENLEKLKEDLYLKRLEINKIEKLIINYQEDKDFLKKDLIKLKKDETLLEVELKNLRIKKERLILLNERLNEKVNTINKNNIKISEIKNSISIYSKRLLEYQNLKIEGKKELEDKINLLNYEINSYNEREENLRNQIQSLNKILSNNIIKDKKQDLILKEQELKNLTFEDIENLNKEKKELSDKLNRLNNQISKISVRLEDIKKTKEKINSMDNCPLCLQEVDNYHKSKIINESEMNINNLIKEELNLKNNFKELETVLKELELKIDTNNQNLKKKEILTSEINSLKELQSEFDNQSKNFNQRKEERDNLIKELDKLKEIDKNKRLESLKKYKIDLLNILNNEKKLAEFKILKNNLKEKEKELLLIEEEQKQIKKEIGIINKEKIELSFIEEKYTVLEQKRLSLKKSIDELSIKYNDLEIKLAESKKEKEGIDKITLILNKDINSMTKKKEKSDLMKKYEIWISKSFMSIISLIEKNVMLKIYYEFNELFQRWFSILIEDEMVISNLNENFTPIIIQNGYELSYEDMSGGERQSVALAYRLALNQVLNDLVQTIKTKDLLILDEPTDGFSSEQLDKIRELLEELTINQIIIVSHEPKIETYVDHVIKIFKEDHKSKILI